MDKAVFLDRDGTIIEDMHYLHEPEKVILCPRAMEGLKILEDAGFLLFVITNQSGVGRGYFPIEDVYAVNTRVSELLSAGGVHILRYYIAPERPDEPSFGRKPSPNFVFKSRDEYDIDLSASFFVGDKIVDLETGWNAGLRQSILVRTGKGTREAEAYPEIGQKGYVCENLEQAAKHILSY